MGVYDLLYEAPSASGDCAPDQATRAAFRAALASSPDQGWRRSMAGRLFDHGLVDPAGFVTDPDPIVRGEALVRTGDVGALGAMLAAAPADALFDYVARFCGPIVASRHLTGIVLGKPRGALALLSYGPQVNAPAELLRECLRVVDANWLSVERDDASRASLHLTSAPPSVQRWAAHALHPERLLRRSLRYMQPSPAGIVRRRLIDRALTEEEPATRRRRLRNAIVWASTGRSVDFARRSHSPLPARVRPALAQLHRMSADQLPDPRLVAAAGYWAPRRQFDWLLAGWVAHVDAQWPGARQSGTLGRALAADPDRKRSEQARTATASLLANPGVTLAQAAELIPAVGRLGAEMVVGSWRRHRNNDDILVELFCRYPYVLDDADSYGGGDLTLCDDPKDVAGRVLRRLGVPGAVIGDPDERNDPYRGEAVAACLRVASDVDVLMQLEWSVLLGALSEALSGDQRAAISRELVRAFGPDRRRWAALFTLGEDFAGTVADLVQLCGNVVAPAEPVASDA